MSVAGIDGMIELRLTALDQLFDPFDPFPIPTRDLSRTAEEFVVGWAREHARSARLTIRIYLPATTVETTDITSVRAAISGHFRYRCERVRSDMHELVSIARLTLLIGLCVLGACMGARQLIRDLVPDNAIAGFLSEGLAILGWVANWRPIEILLFEWWPMNRRRQLFTRLAEAPVEVVHADDRPSDR
jgi:hypothetical protein